MDASQKLDLDLDTLFLEGGLKMWKVKKEEKRKPEMKKKRKKVKSKKQGEEERGVEFGR
jgi:hypothetical protein